MNSIEPTTLLRMGSSLFIRSDAISAKPSSPSVLMLLTLYSSFSLKPTGFHEMRSTFSLSLCSFPTVLISSTFIFLILGTCSERSRLLMVLTLVQSFLTVSSLNLVLYWLCQVRSPRRCFLVKVRVLARLFLRRSPILMFLLMQSLLVTLVLPSTTVNSSSSLRVGTEVRLQHLICCLLKRLKKESGICSYCSWEKVQSIHYLSQSLKSYNTLRSIYIVDYNNARIQREFTGQLISHTWINLYKRINESIKCIYNFHTFLPFFSFLIILLPSCLNTYNLTFYRIQFSFYTILLQSSTTFRQYNQKMQSQKILRPKLNELKTQEQTSFFSDAHSFQRQPMKRFNRSSTSSRSKSREDEKQQASTRFFIKSICSQTNINPQKNTTQEQKLMKILDKAIKREATPVKSRRTIKDKADSQFSPFQQSVQKEIDWLKLERKCQLVEAENLKLIKAKNQMQERIEILEGQLSEAIHQKLYFEEKVREHQHRGQKDYKERGNSNLVRLKREIAKQRDLESVPPSHILQQQLDLAQSELLILRDSLARSERLRKQAQSHAHNHRNEREIFLQDLVQQLKLEVNEKEEELQKARTQVNVLRLRQAKKLDKDQLAKSQQLQTLKRKYGNILKKYHQATQELTAYRRKQQRLNYMLQTSSNSSSRRSLQNSLSLSP